MDLGIGGLGYATEIGAGASAIVYKARQLDLDREVAVKVLKVTDEAFIRRFKREAKTLGKLSQNPGIVTVYDTGVTAAGQPFLILELCESSVLDHLNTTGVFEPLVACQAAAQVADAVADAHDNGVVHRDLKPGNVLLSQTGRYMVTDFGISTVTGATMGQTNSVGFTAGYVAPETLTGEEVGAPSDVYALGATLFHMLAGQAPFVDPEQNSNLLALAQRVVNDPIPDLRPQGIPDQICQIVEAAMAKKPEDRPTAAQLRDQLLAVSGGAAPAMTTAGSSVFTTETGMVTGVDPVTVAVNEADLNTSGATQMAGTDPTVGMAAVAPPGNFVGPQADAGVFGYGTSPQQPPAPGGPSQFEGGILSDLPAEPQQPLGPTAEERRFQYTSDDRMQLGPLLVGAVVGLIALLAVGALLISRSGDDGDGDNGGSALETVESPGTSLDGSGNESTGQGAGGNRGTLNPGQTDETDSTDPQVATVEIPNVAGETATLAESRLAALGFIVNRVDEESSIQPIGNVIRQSPIGGQTAEEGSVVSIYVATREPVETVSVPTVAGMSEADATAALTAAGVTVTVTREPSATVPEDEAIGTSPEVGTTVNVGGDVTLIISDGVPTCASLEGLTEAAAQSQLEAIGLTVTTNQVFSESVNEGLVVSCSQTDTTGTLNISRGPNPCPALIGTDHTAAVASLEAAGLTVTETGTASSSFGLGEVITCSVTGSAATLTWASTVLPADCPAVAGMTVAQATTALEAAGFTTINETPMSSPTVPDGEVISCAVTGATATLTVSTGPAGVPVPDVSGMTVANATAALVADGLRRGPLEQTDSQRPAGEVLGSRPAAGTEVAPDTAVTLLVSNGGVAQVAVPDVVGSTQVVAVQAINAAGLVPDVVTQVVGAANPNLGLVISVAPVAGRMVDEGSTVTITVAVLAPPDP